ncbi:MAG TPA: hypothetical protein PKI14_08685 [Fervidobacterium sp.]|nr:hypothetical protein [Fervidobacterium sp.]HPT54026.1 hypothetical protein [Fervidobacterium sp.]HPZ17825.1 hypothetical protein [Fervidobacterium sp.]HQE48860.1 hypothetical protein [Fervidobacterium sp.]HUM43011.1 hypothetical protein [Fervidobacterium sp.]
MIFTKVSNIVKGSSNYENAKCKLADAHEHVKDGRIDFLHKLSEAIVDQE